MTTQEVVASFMADCKLRGLSRTTLRGYKQHTERLIQLSPQFPPKPEIIQEFLASVNPYTADAHYRTWHAVDNHAHKRFKTKNFMKSVTRPRVPKQIMPTISETELNLLAWALQDATPRDKAILALFLDTAIRAGEANLQRKDIKEDVIIVNGKTGYRIVPISPITRDLLLSLPVHDDGYVFHGTFKYKNTPLKESGLYKVVRRYLIKIGYTGKQFGPQTLRRSFGRFWFKEGGDVRSLQLIYGHASPTTTLIHYAAFQVEDIKEIHHKHSPGRIFEEVK